MATPVLKFTGYQKFVVGILAFLQFAVILDFMLISPLGAVIMPALSIGPTEFGFAVSAYAFSAAVSGLLTAGFADRFDRKRLLLFFYIGFIAGTTWCGLATSFHTLLLARIVTGLFGGVIGSIVLAISTDLFPPQMRGRVMGFIQTAFAASQVLGLPIALFLSNRWNWHAPFIAMAALGLLGGLVVALRMQPVDAHLKVPQEHSAFRHLLNTVVDPHYLLAFGTTALVTTGGFMLMPFSSAYVVNNLKIDLTSLPTLYFITGLCTIFVGPLVGKASDAIGKFSVFMIGTLISIVMVIVFTHLPPVPLYVLVIVNSVMFVGIFSRVIPFQAIMSTIPSMQQRGSFNAINSATQQMAGGLASVIAGHIVTRNGDGTLGHIDVIGYAVASSAVVAFVLVWKLNRRSAAVPAVQGAPQPAMVE